MTDNDNDFRYMVIYIHWNNIQILNLLFKIITTYLNELIWYLARFKCSQICDAEELSSAQPPLIMTLLYLEKRIKLAYYASIKVISFVFAKRCKIKKIC